MVWPVMKSPAFDPISTAAPAISSGTPMRNSGERAVAVSYTHLTLPTNREV